MILVKDVRRQVAYGSEGQEALGVLAGEKQRLRLAGFEVSTAVRDKALKVRKKWARGVRLKVNSIPVSPASEDPCLNEPCEFSLES
jgi:hypothetical protein